MTMYFTSDLHYSHSNVIKFCNRPYLSAHHMNVSMTEEWNRIVKTDDIVYVLGDFSMNARAMEQIVPKLQGMKILVAGNHDHCFSGTQKKRDRYINAGWFDVINGAVNITIGGHTVTLSHFPYRSPEGTIYDTRFMEHRPVDNGLTLLHGHLHARYIKRKNMIDVGWDGRLSLYSEDDIIKLIEDEREYIPSRISDFYIGELRKEVLDDVINKCSNSNDNPLLNVDGSARSISARYRQSGEWPKP